MAHGESGPRHAGPEADAPAVGSAGALADTQDAVDGGAQHGATAKNAPQPSATRPGGSMPGAVVLPDAAGERGMEDGSAVVNTRRVSIARHLGTNRPSLPFTPQQLARLDEALTFASRETKVAFSVYLGALGQDSRGRAEEMFASLGESADRSVLVAVSPAQRIVEIVTGQGVHRRVSDHAARLAVTAMVASFKEGDLAGGLVSGLRMLADQAGRG